MNIFFRILLAVYAFSLTILTMLLIIVTLKPYLFNTLVTYVSNQLSTNTNTEVLMLVVEGVFLILSIIFLMSGFKSEKEKKSVSKITSIGEIKISLNSIESIALGTARKVVGIRDTKANVIKNGDAVSINIRIIVLPDVNIPLLSEDLQLKIKKSVEDSAGILVNDVSILVENIHSGIKSRVE